MGRYFQLTVGILVLLMLSCIPAARAAADAGAITVIKATWGVAGAQMDVTQKVQELINATPPGGEYTPSYKTLGDPAPKNRGKELELTYSVGGQTYTKTFKGEKAINLATLVPGQIAKLHGSTKAVFVRRGPDGELYGVASDVILTAVKGTSKGATPVSTASPVGKDIRTGLDDALRFIRISNPVWGASKVELSFEDKELPKNGGGIGGAMGTLVLSMLEGFDIAGDVAITGDVGADGKIRPMGGVDAKVRGATTGKCVIVAIPTDNYDQLVDAFVYNGPALVTRIQVLGVSTLDDAAAVARVDRQADLAQAVALFGEVQATLAKAPDDVHSQAVQDKLTQVLQLAPAHFSAKLLLALSKHEEPKKLSTLGTLYYTSQAAYSLDSTLFLRGTTELVPRGPKVAAAAAQDTYKNLAKVRAIADPKAVDIVDSVHAYVLLLVASPERGSGPHPPLDARAQKVSQELSGLDANHDVLEKLLREGI